MTDKITTVTVPAPRPTVTEVLQKLKVRAEAAMNEADDQTEYVRSAAFAEVLDWIEAMEADRT